MNSEKTIKRWINLNDLPRISGSNAINWAKSIGCTMAFTYGNYDGEVTILDKLQNDKYKVLISYGNNAVEYITSSSSLRNCRFGNVFIRPISVTHPELIKYFLNIDDANKHPAHSEHRVNMVCPFCGTHRKQMIRLLVDCGLACPACSDGISYPNKLMFNILTQLNICFQNEITKATPGFEWIIGNYRYDFYIECRGEKIFIEMDGAFHTRNNFVSCEHALKTDNIKDELALQHSVKVLRIDCAYSKIQDRLQYIKAHIIASELNSLFDLNRIDWMAAHNFAIDSNIRLAAELWNKNNYCAIDIGKYLGVSRDTARGYLKIAAELHLCNYNDETVEERMLQRIAQNNKKKAKPIALYKDGDMLNVFNGVVELDEKSNELYGVHIDFRNAHAVCRGNRSQAYGYTMKYITRAEYEQLLPQFRTAQN